MPLEEVDKFINKTREIRDEFIKYSSNDDETISSLFACLHKDIISTLTNLKNLGKNLKEFDHSNLWINNSEYNIFKTNFEIIDLPRELKNIFSETKVRQAIWVLKPNGEAAFGGRQTLNFSGKHEVHHIDLANGKSVLSAGTILFFEDMTKIIAINPNSGHFRPSVESCSHMMEVMSKSLFNTKDIVICDLNWKPTNIKNTVVFTPPKPKKVASNILCIREKCLILNKNANSVTLN